MVKAKLHKPSSDGPTNGCTPRFKLAKAYKGPTNEKNFPKLNAAAKALPLTSEGKISDPYVQNTISITLTWILIPKRTNKLTARPNPLNFKNRFIPRTVITVNKTPYKHILYDFTLGM